MKVSFGSNLIEQALANNINRNIPKQEKSVMQSTTPSSFGAEIMQPKKSKQIIDALAKYSGIVALIALPVVFIVMKKINSKTIKTLTSKITEQSEIIKQLTEAIAKGGPDNPVVIKEVKEAGTGLLKLAVGTLSVANIISAQKNGAKPKEQEPPSDKDKSSPPRPIPAPQTDKPDLKLVPRHIPEIPSEIETEPSQSVEDFEPPEETGEEDGEECA